MSVAFVTGASRGIGRAIALHLAAAGHQVACGYASDEDAAGKTAAAAGGIAVQLDVGQPSSVEAAFASIEQQTGAKVGILVNNAGVTGDGLVMRTTDDQWSRVLRTNLDGAFHTIRRAAPGMVRARSGRIVNVGSVVGMLGSPGQSGYAAAKAGLIGLSRSVARELASRGITCNVVAPGPIDTDMLAAVGDERLTEITGQVPLERLGTTDEVAAVVAFLCSDAAGYVSGAVVPVDGGLGMGH